VYEFEPSGALQFRTAALVKMNYSHDGQRLRMDDDSIGIAWLPDGRLALQFEKGTSETYQRVGPAMDGDRLLGEWRGTRRMEGRDLEVRLLFKTGGRMLMVLYLRSAPGVYRRNNRGWTLVLGRMDGVMAEWKVESQRLRITLPGKDAVDFERF
jgi:hypothetical protein